MYVSPSVDFFLKMSFLYRVQYLSTYFDIGMSFITYSEISIDSPRCIPNYKLCTLSVLSVYFMYVQCRNINR